MLVIERFDIKIKTAMPFFHGIAVQVFDMNDFDLVVRFFRIIRYQCVINLIDRIFVINAVVGLIC